MASRLLIRGKRQALARRNGGPAVDLEELNRLPLLLWSLEKILLQLELSG